MNKKDNAPTINPADDDFGAILNCAVRYALGRQTYIPHLVMDFIRPLLPYVLDKTLWCLERDIRDAAVYGCGYGDPDIDEPAWKRFLGEVQKEIERRSK